MGQTVLILGASTTETRYSNMAANRLVEQGHRIILVGNSRGEVAGCEILKEPPTGVKIDSITMYLNPSHQKHYYDYILRVKPDRIIFNPGTENEVLEKMAHAAGIKTEHACTLVLIATHAF